MRGTCLRRMFSGFFSYESRCKTENDAVTTHAFIYQWGHILDVYNDNDMSNLNYVVFLFLAPRVLICGISVNAYYCVYLLELVIQEVSFYNIIILTIPTLSHYMYKTHLLLPLY